MIFTTADVARQGKAYWGAYAAAGAALENLTQTWASELAENTTIRLNTLDPGAVHTALRAAVFPGEDASTLPSPDAVMHAYLFLMGPDSRDNTGSPSGPDASRIRIRKPSAPRRCWSLTPVTQAA